MAPDDDLLASLPPPPPPRPAAREAAIGAAMRRFDGVGDAPPEPATARGSWARLDPPRVGALVAVTLAVTVGLPLWMIGDHHPAPVEERAPVARNAAPGAPPIEAPAATMADARVPMPSEPSLAHPAAPATVAPPAAPLVESRAQRAPAAEQRSDGVAAFEVAPPPAIVASAPVAAAPAPPPPTAEPARDAENIVVTGSRVGGEAAKARARTAEGALARTDRSACTIDDPAHDLDACRRTIAAELSGPAATALTEGLSLAWQGDSDAALAAFDRAVRYAPQSARAHYNRSLLLQRRGDARRARSDARRAATLDRRYE